MGSSPNALFSLSDFVTGTLTSLAASALSGLIKRYASIGLPIPIQCHKRELREKLREMPFIYKDIDTEVLNDFVDVDIEHFNLNEFRPASASFPLSAERRMQDRRKTLLLGNAGIGKTTYIRHRILSLIDGRPTPFLNPSEVVVPFYVPLKAVENSRPWPIGRYLVDNNLYLAGGRGRRKLLHLARGQRAMLFLDGYDEIQVDLGSRNLANFIRADLDVLVGKGRPRLGTEDKYFCALYNALAECRVWVSSRREFYASNPFDLSRVYDSKQGRLDCLGLMLQGITHSRALLVRQLFEKYRHRAKIYGELLSEELFLQQIDRSGNDELRELSQNPLFLTMMCYVYVAKVLETEQPTAPFASTTSELVLRCVNLLLHDIDAHKARSLPAAQRAALIRRRNSYESEKRAFLPYFAWTVLCERRNVFDIRYINRKALDFFRRQPATASTKSYWMRYKEMRCPWILWDNNWQTKESSS